MTFVMVVPTLLCALVMAAHFFRAWSFDAGMGNQAMAVLDLMLVGASLVAPFFLLIRTRRAMRVVQVLLVLGAVVMWWKGIAIVQERMTEGNPRLVPPLVIMGVVGVFFVMAALLYQTRRMKARWPKGE